MLGLNEEWVAGEERVAGERAVHVAEKVVEELERVREREGRVAAVSRPERRVDEARRGIWEPRLGWLPAAPAVLPVASVPAAEATVALPQRRLFWSCWLWRRPDPVLVVELHCKLLVRAELVCGHSAYISIRRVVENFVRGVHCECTV